MPNFSDNRKRSREDDIYSDVPLSKRINNLHLTNEQPSTSNNENSQFNYYQHQFALQQQQQLSELSINENANVGLMHQNAILNGQNSGFTNHSLQQQFIHHHYAEELSSNGMNADSVGNEAAANYQPELDEQQNPYYYMSNKLLHDLHFERLKRNNL